MQNDNEPRGAFDKVEYVLKLKSALPDGTRAESITLGALSDGMEERAFGLLLLLLALPCTLPFVYGLPQIVALPMLILAYQMASGCRAPWLPETLRKRQIPVQSFLRLLSQIRRYSGWLERLAHARFLRVTSPLGIRITGGLLLIPCTSILVPLPLTNTVPGIAVAISAVGLIERDGLFVWLGIIGGLIWVSLLVIGGPTLVYLSIDWLFNR